MNKVLSRSLGLLLLLSGQQLQAEENEVQRIIALSPHSVEILFLLGAGDRIVGTTMFADYPEAAKEIPRVGGHTGIQIDRVLELEPDLVIAWEGGNPEKDLTRITQLGLALYKSSTKTLEGIPKEIERIGALIGLKEEGLLQATRYRERLAEIRANYANRAPVSFFYQLWSKPLRAMAQGSWINQMFEGCGAENIFNDPGQDYPQVSMEVVIESKPEVIVVPTHHGGEISVELWKDWPEIPAVANDNIVFFDGDLLHRFSYRTLDGMQQVCDKFQTIRASRLETNNAQKGSS